MKNNCVENKIWLQQENESDLQYKRFEDFLNYNGNLKSYIEKELMPKTELKFNYIKNKAAEFCWVKRKIAYENYKNEIALNSGEELDYQIIFQSVKKIEEEYNKIHNVALKYLNSKKKNEKTDLNKCIGNITFKLAVSNLEELQRYKKKLPKSNYE